MLLYEDPSRTRCMCFGPQYDDRSTTPSPEPDCRYSVTMDLYDHWRKLPSLTI